MKGWPALAWLLVVAPFFTSQRSLSRAALLVPSKDVLSGEPPSSSAPNPLESCLDVPQAICLENNVNDHKYVVAATDTLPDLVLWYQFDQNLPLDDSGHSRHLVDMDHRLSSLVTGPGIMSRGGSAAFDGLSHRVADAEAGALSSSTFTIALWIYLLEDSLGDWRTVFNRAAGPDELWPALLLWPDSRRLRFGAGPRGGLDSTGVVPLRRWTHVAVASTGSTVHLYINGVKDSEAILEVPTPGEDGHLYLGHDPWRAGTKAYMDDFRWYSRALSKSEIKALTLPMLTGFPADNVHLGCPACTFAEAAKSCGLTRGAHVCSMQELMTGGLHTARANGWLHSQSNVWYIREEVHDDLFNGDQRLGLCCTS